jgi:hypothetical protein
MKRIGFVAVAVAVFAIALPVAAQLNDTYIIPAVGNAPGANNTQWATSLSVFNPHTDYALTVSVIFIPTGGANGLEALVTVPANGTFVSDNILADAFKTSGTGSLFVATFPEDNSGVEDTLIARSFLVIGKTFNNAATGTFGQTIPGVWTGLQDIDTDGISSVAHNISDNAAFRTNVGAVNLGRCSVTVHVSVYDANGQTLLQDAPFTVPPLGHLQDRLPVTVDKGSVEFYVDDPCADNADNYAVVFPYTSTIDNKSGDPSYQSPVLLATPGVLYSAAAKGMQPTTIGKKIDLSFARRLRATAMRVGPVSR